MLGREYYTEATDVPATAQNTYRELSRKSRAVLIVSPLLNITIKTVSGEEITLPNVTGAPGTNATIFPYSISEIKANITGGIPANRVYELF